MLDDVFGLADPLIGVGELGDMDEAVFAGKDLDKRAELEEPDDSAFELVAGAERPGQVFDSLLRRVACRAVYRRDIDRAVLLDVNLRTGIGGDLLDRLAARSDDQADLLGFDVQRDDARRIVDRVSRGAAIASVILSKMNKRASRAWANAWTKTSRGTPPILVSSCRAVMPSAVPATLKSMSPEKSSMP